MPALLSPLKPRGSNLTALTSPPFSDESSDVSREEEKWTTKHEAMLFSLVEDCNIQAYSHRRMHAYLKTMHGILATACILLQTSAGVCSLASDTRVSNTIALTMTGLSFIVSGAFSLANIGSLAQRHTRACSRYETLRHSIAYTLCRKRRYREACDIRMHKFMESYNSFSKNSPRLYEFLTPSNDKPSSASTGSSDPVHGSSLPRETH